MASFSLPFVAIIAGSGLMTVSPPLILGGVRKFNGSKTPLPVLGAGVAIWLTMGMGPMGIDAQRWSILSSFLAWSVYLGASVWCMWGAGRESFKSQIPLMAILGMHALLYLAGSVQVATGGFSIGAAPALNSLFGLIHFETIFFTMGTTMFMLLICKERIDRQYREAAKFDVLTGALNRRILCDSGQRMLERCHREDRPLSMIIFDLDRFKLINDHYGHLGGDQILRSFANTVRSTLRPNDLFGRYGGEEFVVLLADTPVESACFIAERIRTSFARQHRFLEGQPVNATVSAGVTEDQGERELEDVIRNADRALYLAKNNGRNRVEKAEPSLSDNGQSAANTA